MQIFEHIVQLLSAISWPATVLIIFYGFRRQLTSVLPGLRRFKAGPVEAEFEKEIEQISNEQMRHLQNTLSSSQEALTRKDELAKIAQVSPRTAIIDAWHGIEFTLKKAILQRLGGNSPPPNISSPISMIRELAKEGCLDTSDVSLLHELKGIRNQIMYLPDFEPSYKSVIKFVELAVLIQEKLYKLSEISI